MNKDNISKFVEQTWSDSITSTLVDYIKIKNKSPAYDPDWHKNGYMMEAAELLMQWCNDNAAKDMTMELITLEGRTPLIYIEVPGQTDETVLLYGHYDKQPEMEGWDDDLGPWKPVLRDDKLYGRGGADDGYAIFSSLTAINALQKEGIPHPRCVLIIEGCEESGSYDLPYYIDALKDKIGTPKLVVCLDSGCGNYDQMWCTTSLRGMISGVLSVEVSEEGVHSGMASGSIPDPARIARNVLNRVEDIDTGEVLLPALQVDIPEVRVQQAKATADTLGEDVMDLFPLLDGVKAMSDDKAELLLNRTWRATVTMIGSNLPTLVDASNTLRPTAKFMLSFRLPPTCDSDKAAAAIKEALEAHAPYNAKVSFEMQDAANGWHAPPMSDFLTNLVDESGQTYFNKPSMYMGEGGTIPFMGMLGEKFPKAEFVITGVLGPKSNAHGPNEFLHIPTAKKLTGCVAHILAAYAK